MPSNATARFGGIQSLRGVAAFLVLLQHVTFYTFIAKNTAFERYLAIDLGWMGVQCFFVISGFVMAGCFAQGKMFIVHRLARIYPGYWLSILVSYLLLTDTSFGWKFDWNSFFLVPAPLNQSLKIPYWTLVYEMVFYAATYVFAFFRAKAAVIERSLLVWMLAISLAPKYISIDMFEPGGWILLSRLNVYFILGMLLALNYEAASRLSLAVTATAAIVLWNLGDALQRLGAVPSGLFLGLGFCAVVLLGIKHIHVKALEFLGDTSYGLYLLHVPITVVAVRSITGRYPAIPLPALWMVTLVIAATGAIAFGWSESRVHSGIKVFLRARNKRHERAARAAPGEQADKTPARRPVAKILILPAVAIVAVAVWLAASRTLEQGRASVPVQTGMSGVAQQPPAGTAYGSQIPSAFASKAPEAGGECYIDSLNRQLVAPRMEVPRNADLIVDGWVVDSDKKASEHVAVELASLEKGQNYYATANRWKRAGLGKALGDPALDLAAIISSGAMQSVPQGSYAIRLLTGGGNSVTRCDPSVTLIVK